MACQFELASFVEIQMASDYNVQLLDFHPHFMSAVQQLDCTAVLTIWAFSLVEGARKIVTG